MNRRVPWQEATATPLLVIAGVDATRMALLQAPDYPRRITTMLKNMTTHAGCLHHMVLTKDLTTRLIVSWWRSPAALHSWYTSPEHRSIVEYATRKAELARSGEVKSWIDIYAPTGPGIRFGEVWPKTLRLDSLRHEGEGNTPNAARLVCVGAWGKGTSLDDVSTAMGSPECAWNLKDLASGGSVLLFWPRPRQRLSQRLDLALTALPDGRQPGDSGWIETFDPLGGGIRSIEEAGSPLSRGRIIF